VVIEWLVSAFEGMIETTKTARIELKYDRELEFGLFFYSNHCSCRHLCYYIVAHIISIIKKLVTITSIRRIKDRGKLRCEMGSVCWLPFWP
jgi:hypothetical protein